MSLLANLRPLGLRPTALVGRVRHLLPSHLGRAALSSTSVKQYAPLTDELSAKTLAAGFELLVDVDKQVLQPLFLQATDRESAVAALEELERRLKLEQVLGSCLGTVVRFIVPEAYYRGLVGSLITHLAPQILGKDFFSGFGSAHVPRLIPTDLTRAQCQDNANLPRPLVLPALPLLGIIVFAPLVGAGVYVGFLPVAAAGGSGELSLAFLRSFLLLNPLFSIVAVLPLVPRRRQIAIHEAGHFLVAYKLPLCGYSLSSVIKVALTGMGGHVRCAKPTGAPSDSLLFGMASMGMASVAAECVYQGFSTSTCSMDLKVVDGLLCEHRPSWSAKQRAAYQKVALYDAHHLLRQLESILRELAATMDESASSRGAVPSSRMPSTRPAPIGRQHPPSLICTWSASERRRRRPGEPEAQRIEGKQEDSARTDEPTR
ncbi:hypothetical protein T492DRAFT_1151978 [Pavlovales sp. CCMP2436]|nr:hypothetical protein T492DRAFT_1151978 [Pavlovales sp. CCMP2436]